MPASGQGTVPSAVMTHVPRQWETGSYLRGEKWGAGGVRNHNESCLFSKSPSCVDNPQTSLRCPRGYSVANLGGGVTHRGPLAAGMRSDTLRCLSGLKKKKN